MFFETSLPSPPSPSSMSTPGRSFPSTPTSEASTTSHVHTETATNTAPKSRCATTGGRHQVRLGRIRRHIAATGKRPGQLTFTVPFSSECEGFKRCGLKPYSDDPPSLLYQSNRELLKPSCFVVARKWYRKSKLLNFVTFRFTVTSED